MGNFVLKFWEKFTLASYVWILKKKPHLIHSCLCFPLSVYISEIHSKNVPLIYQAPGKGLGI